jgi:hypothetical protein
MVNKGSRVIGDGMKGRTTLQKRLEDAEIGTITAFGQVWLRLLAHPRCMFVGFHNDFQILFC